MQIKFKKHLLFVIATLFMSFGASFFVNQNTTFARQFNSDLDVTIANLGNIYGESAIRDYFYRGLRADGTSNIPDTFVYNEDTYDPTRANNFILDLFILKDPSTGKTSQDWSEAVFECVTWSGVKNPNIRINIDTAKTILSCIEKRNSFSNILNKYSEQLIKNHFSSGDSNYNMEKPPVKRAIAKTRIYFKNTKSITVRPGDTFVAKIYADIKKSDAEMLFYLFNVTYDSNALEAEIVNYKGTVFEKKNPVISVKKKRMLEFYQPLTEKDIVYGYGQKMFEIKFRAKSLRNKSQIVSDIFFDKNTYISNDPSTSPSDIDDSIRVSIGDPSVICPEGQTGTPPNCKEINNENTGSTGNSDTKTGESGGKKDTNETGDEKKEDPNTKEKDSGETNITPDIPAVKPKPVPKNDKKTDPKSSPEKPQPKPQPQQPKPQPRPNPSNNNPQPRPNPAPYNQNIQNQSRQNSSGKRPLPFATPIESIAQRGVIVQTESDQIKKSTLPGELGGSYSDSNNAEGNSLSATSKKFVIGALTTRTSYDNFVINWKTNRPGVSTMKIGRTIDDLDSEVKVTRVNDTENKASVEKLQPANKYYYEITAKETGTDEVEKYKGEFTTRGYPIKILARNREAPIKDLDVKLKDKDSASATTDQDGAAFFETSPGKHTVVVTVNGVNYEQPISVEKIDFPEKKAPSTQQFILDISKFTVQNGSGGVAGVLKIVGLTVLLIVMLTIAVIVILRKKNKKSAQYNTDSMMFDFDNWNSNNPYNQYQQPQNGQQYSYQNPQLPRPPKNPDVPENEYFSDL